MSGKVESGQRRRQRGEGVLWRLPGSDVVRESVAPLSGLRLRESVRNRSRPARSAPTGLLSDVSRSAATLSPRDEPVMHAARITMFQRNSDTENPIDAVVLLGGWQIWSQQ